MYIRLTYVRLSIHTTLCHDGAFSWNRTFSVDKKNSAQIAWQYVLSIPTVHMVSKNLTRSVWFSIQSINQSAKLNWILINFQVKIVALMPCVFNIISHYFTLSWKWCFFRVNETTLNAFTFLLKKPNLLKCACIDHNSFACCFSWFLKGVTSSLRKSLWK